MVRILALAALLLTAAAPAPDAEPEIKLLPARAGGRAVADEDGATRFGWPAVYFEGRFQGDWVGVAIETDTELFRLLIDGKERDRLGPDKKTARIDGLGPGAHVVRLEKLTESQSGSSRFLGFTIDKSALVLAPEARAHRIEFIGDSHTVGYGNTSPKRECTRQEVHDTTDTQQAFGPLAAKRLDWDYRVIAYSGYGIVRNYDGGVPGDSLPKRYGRSIPGEEALAIDTGWKPDWIVIKLGSNDFSTPLHKGEAWKDLPALHADYRARYAEFLTMLQEKQPQARFLLMAADPFYGDVEAVAKGAARPVKLVRWVELENTGCDWHPSLKDHRNLADQVEGVIRGG